MTDRVIDSTPAGAGGLDTDVPRMVEQHRKLAAILAGRLGNDHANLLSVPKPGEGGVVDWTTRLGGDIVAAASLPETERARLAGRLRQLLGDIAGTAATLLAEGGAAAPVAAMLAGLVARAQEAPLFSVGGKAVVSRWWQSVAEPAAVVPAAGAQSGAAGPRAAVAGAGAGDAGDGVAGAGVAGAGVAGVAKGRARTPAWLLAINGVALASLLIAAAFWAGLRWWQAKPAGAQADTPLAAAVAGRDEARSRLDSRRREIEALRCVPDPPPDRYAGVKERIAQAGKDCALLAGLLEQEPQLREVSGEGAGLREGVERMRGESCQPPAPPVASDPVPPVVSDPKPPVASDPVPKSSPPTAAVQCPGVRPPETAPDMALVIDASRSMQFSIDATPEQVAAGNSAEKGLDGLAGLARLMPQLVEPLQRAVAVRDRPPQRMPVSRQAAETVVANMPSDMHIGLVTVENCPVAKAQGRFGPAQRNQLRARIRAIEPVGGTPLASGIELAGRYVDGVRQDALIVIVSDGQESCEGDPCTAARRLKQAKPRLQINVVDIGGTGAGNCVASATGGKVFTARDAQQIQARIREASREVMAPAGCKP